MNDASTPKVKRKGGAESGFHRQHFMLSKCMDVQLTCLPPFAPPEFEHECKEGCNHPDSKCSDATSHKCMAALLGPFDDVVGDDAVVRKACFCRTKAKEQERQDALEDDAAEEQCLAHLDWETEQRDVVKKCNVARVATFKWLVRLLERHSEGSQDDDLVAWRAAKPTLQKMRAKANALRAKQAAAAKVVTM